MQKSISLYLIFSMILSGCTSTHMVLKNQASFEKLNRDLNEKNVMITMIDREEYTGTFIHLDTSSVTLNTVEDIMQLQTQDVAELSYNNSSRAGIISGLFALVGIPLVLGISTKGHKYAVGAGLILGLLVTPFAYAIGSSIGATEMYKLNDIITADPQQMHSGDKKTIKMEISAITAETDSSIFVLRRGTETEILRENIIDVEQIDGKTVIILSRGIYIRLFQSR